MSPAALAVVFDVDGTLVDSERDGHRPAFNAAFAALGLPHHWDEREYGELLAIAGGQRRLRSYLLASGYPPAQAQTLAAGLHARKTAIFTELVAAGEVPARPGTRRLLDELAVAGVPVAVATTGSRSWVEPLLARQFGLDRFALVLTGDEVPELKPSPAVYTEVLRRTGWSVASTVAVEDSKNGLAAATGAGLSCLVVVNDYTRSHDMNGAPLVVDGFGDGRPARVLHGPPEAVHDGVVSADTLRWLTREACPPYDAERR